VPEKIVRLFNRKRNCDVAALLNKERCKISILFSFFNTLLLDWT